MRRHTSFFVCLLVAGCLAGCFGEHAKDTVLIPSMEAAWPGVRVDATNGGAVQNDLDEYEAALSAKDRIKIVNLWPPIKIMAESGIKGDSPGLQKLKAERIKNFNDNVNKIAGQLF